MYFSEAEIQKCTATKGDLLVCEGGDIGRAAIWSYGTDIRIQNHIHRLRAYSEICVEYYYYIFFLYKHVGWIVGKGIGIQGLSSNALHSLLFPLPPLQEQHRIVPQDPSDEPASVLLERIRVEKERLIQKGKIKRDKHESVIYRRDNSHYRNFIFKKICYNSRTLFLLSLFYLQIHIRF